MKRFQFRLDKLLHYHQQRQKQADLALARANMDRTTAAEEVRRVNEAIQKACGLAEEVGQAIEPTLREQSLQLAHQLCQALQQAEEKLKTAEQRFREAQSERTAITQEVEALLHLRTQQLAAHQDEVVRQQQIEVDDVVMKQWSRKTSRELVSAMSDKII